MTGAGLIADLGRALAATEEARAGRGLGRYHLALNVSQLAPAPGGPDPGRWVKPAPPTPLAVRRLRPAHGAHPRIGADTTMRRIA